MGDCRRHRSPAPGPFDDQNGGSWQAGKWVMSRRPRVDPAAGQDGWGSAERASQPLSQIPWPCHRSPIHRGGGPGRPGYAPSLPALARQRSARPPAPDGRGPRPGHRRAPQPPPSGADRHCGQGCGSGAGAGAAPRPHHRARRAAGDRVPPEWPVAAAPPTRRLNPGLQAAREPRAVSRSGWRWRNSSSLTSFTV